MSYIVDIAVLFLILVFSAKNAPISEDEITAAIMWLSMALSLFTIYVWYF